ncbi:di-heme oxidoredictase family protein [Minwuia sp.]|uniref:di-heme oxidoreductase family protein n=1 Tax=Minwuia sp. TaxID=2493630 RepID=UPI003A901DC4
MKLLSALTGLALIASSTSVLADVASDAAERRQAILAPTSDFTQAERWEDLSGGSATNRTRFDGEAFSLPSASMSFTARADFFVGNGIFRRLWVSSPSSTTSADGLGPVYNARACQRCHLKDGRGHPPAGPDDSAVSMLIKLSVPARNDAERAQLASGRANVIPEPTYGEQLQDLAVPGVPPEGRVRVTYSDHPVKLDDGTRVVLQRPHYNILNPGYGAFDPDMRISPRIAPPMIGLGLLEAIPEADILAAEDPDDRDGDGISGRANRVWSDARQQMMLGRFGWKAAKPTIDDQSSGAMAGDIGVSNPLSRAAWGECTARQPACRNAPHGATGDGLEAGAEIMDPVFFYSRHLAVPARRDVDDPLVLQGKALFYGAGCIGCHTPKHATRSDWPDRALAGQLIWPYTDLLLHDMGEGLADNRPDGRADGREWRTPPLWGIGLTETVNGHTRFLHDGRARNLTEAILWHGGEAEAAKNRFADLSAGERAALLKFLESL